FDRNIGAMIDFFEMVKCAGDQTFRRSMAVEHIDRLEKSTGLHLPYHCSCNRASGVHSPAMIVIEVQLLGRLPVRDRTFPQEFGGAKLSDCRCAEDRLRPISSRSGSGNVQDVITWVPDLACTAGQARERSREPDRKHQFWVAHESTLHEASVFK